MELEAGAGCAKVLPAEGGPDRFAGGGVPNDGRASLVRHRDARDPPDVGQAGARHFQHGARDRGAVELDKPGERVLGGQVDLSFCRERPVGTDHAGPYCAAAYVDHEDADGWPLFPWSGSGRGGR